jgi:hypothetical protein
MTPALSTLTAAILARPELGAALGARWRWRGSGENGDSGLSPEVLDAANRLAQSLPAITQSDPQVAALEALFAEPVGEVLLAWCSASVWRPDVRMAPLLTMAAAHPARRDAVALVARDRVVQGPLLDALACASHLGTGSLLALPGGAEPRARLEILIWEAGASAVEVPSLGPWLWGSRETFDLMVRQPAHGALRGRVLAARCLEVSAGGMSPTADPELVDATLRLLQPLLLHPEPLVWIHAARALGRLTGTL